MWLTNLQEKLYGKEVILADRELVESRADEMLDAAATGNAAMLVVGDPYWYVYVLPCARPVLCCRRRRRRRRSCGCAMTPGRVRSATTHVDLALRAKERGIEVRVIHNASIMNAMGACGLQLYNFGRAVTVPFFTETWKPDSFYDKIAYNSKGGMHTLVLLGTPRPYHATGNS